MARSIYIASPAAGTGKSTVALGLVSTLTKVVAKVGVFRPFVTSRQADPFLDLLLARSGSATPASAAIGTTWHEYHADPDESLAAIVSAYREEAREHDAGRVAVHDVVDRPSGLLRGQVLLGDETRDDVGPGRMRHGAPILEGSPRPRRRGRAG